MTNRDLPSGHERQRQRQNGVAYSYMSTTRRFSRSPPEAKSL